MKRARLGQLLLGVEGIALHRGWIVGERDAGDRRVEEIARFVRDIESGLAGVELDVPELDVRCGYRSWAPLYDERPNPLIRLEEPLVRALIEETPRGRALDAACGTGRHTERLRSSGHEVIGVDSSPDMLEVARKRLPDVEFRQGVLTDLPLETASMDLVVCALALSHCPELRAPISELARVLRPGGRMVLSDFHPLAIDLGGQAFFERSEGGYAYVRSYSHGVGEYVEAALAAGLGLRRCMEPRWGEEEAAIIGGPLFPLAPEAFRAAFVGLPGALVLDLAKTGQI